MQYTAYLALIGAISGAQAIQTEAQGSCSMRTVNKYKTNVDRYMTMRFLANNECKSQYEAWQSENSLAQTSSSSTLTTSVGEESCEEQLAKYKAAFAKLVHFNKALSDRPFNRCYYNKYWWIRRQQNNERRGYNTSTSYKKFRADQKAWEAENPMFSDESEEEEDNNGEEDLPWITQKPVNTKTCDGAFQRLIREGEGRIKVPAGKKFEDISFPADHTSINQNEKVDLTWKRPTDFESQPSLWGSKGVNPGAISQGGVGDCWFLAAISAIAEWPERIHKIFNNQKSYPSNGQFTINFYNYGKEQRVQIDDRLPGTVWGNGKKFMTKMANKSRYGAWWAPMLEKAAAKYYGTYEHMDAGRMKEAFDALLNVPTYYHDPEDYETDEYWKVIQDYEKKNYIMTSAVDLEDDEELGLVGGHAYTVLGAKEYKDEHGEVHRLVKCRNPWDEEYYEGPWNDWDDEVWTDRAKKALDHTTMDDGSFFIPIEQFKRYFYGITVAKYQEWHRAQKTGQWNRKTSHKPKYRFTNPVDQEVAIRMDGPSGRHFKTWECKCAAQAEWNYYRVKNIKTGKYIKSSVFGTSEPRQFSWLEVSNLPAGDYELQILTSWDPYYSGGPENFGLVTLGGEKELKWE